MGDSDPLTGDPALFHAKKNLNSAKSNRIFLRKGREGRAFILTYFDSPMAVVFPRYYFFFDCDHLQGETGVKVGPKVQTLGPPLFHRNHSPSKKLQTMFLFSRVRICLLVRVLAKLDHIWGSEGPSNHCKQKLLTQWSSGKHFFNRHQVLLNYQ